LRFTRWVLLPQTIHLHHCHSPQATGRHTAPQASEAAKQRVAAALCETKSNQISVLLMQLDVCNHMRNPRRIPVEQHHSLRKCRFK
jgi:hypothetical protein